jgi:hypothetical protein
VWERPPMVKKAEKKGGDWHIGIIIGRTLT